MGILPKESRLVSEEKYDNDATMAEVEEGGNEGVWIYGEDEPLDDFRYNREDKMYCCITQEHIEGCFEASN